MKKSKTFKDLIVWQKAHQFVLNVYLLTKKFPNDEKFGLTSQFRRAALSITANICEGFRKNGKKDKIRFLNYSQGSIEECRYYLILSQDLGYCNSEELDELLQEVSKLADAYVKALLNS